MVDTEKFSAKIQWEYWLGVSMSQYLEKHLCPDIANTTRELSKMIIGANPAAYKELLHVIKYVLDMKNLGLKIKPMVNSNKPWKIVF